MNKYPVYIISKGRWGNPLTAKCFIRDGINFKIAVEPQEYENYRQSIPEKYIAVLPFSNLGLGSYPARNWCWEDSIKNGFKRHWLFDDNIRNFYRVHKGNRFLVNGLKAIEVVEEFTDRYKNIGISGFNYKMFAAANSIGKPFRINHHIYSGMLIYNDVPYRWRLRYNEDTDLNLQFLTNKWCLVQFTAFVIDKMATMTMKGGNTDELYVGDGRLKMARAIEEIWPQYVQVKWRFGRPQHFVDWGKHFKHNLIRRDDIDWDEVSKKKFDLKLVKLAEPSNSKVAEIYEQELQNG